MSKKVIYSYKTNAVSPAYLAHEREVFRTVNYQSTVKYKNACRYKNLRTIQDETTGKIYHESWDQKFVDRSKNDQYFVVTLVEENRLDIISNYFYETPKYWWVIALANYIKDPFDIPVGKQLRIPQITSLYNEGGVLSGR